ncbi:MAG TPA: metallophosphoesterase [Planctomycetota bacterium]|nr:metallophosphoesterase [Planctomycetota bacterium]
MVAFLLAVVACFAASQLYVYWKLRRAVPARGPWRALVIGWLLAVGAAFFLSRVFEAAGWRRAATATGLVSHWWVAATMWFGGMCLAADAWNLALRLLARAWPGVGRARIPARALALAVVAVVVVLSAWGFVEPWAVQLETLAVHAPQLPPGSKPIRIVQVTDLHLNALMSRGRLARVIERIREARPDLLVFTGDFADEAGEHVAGLAAMLAEVHAPLGKLAVTGNHEFYRGLQHSLPLIEAAGFGLLRNQCIRVAPGLLVAGVDDYAAARLGLIAPDEEGRILPGRDRADFVLLLKHRPYIEKGSAGRFDLQLSGHIHGGQVFPARWLLMLFCQYTIGRYDLGEGSALYVSRGAGTFGAPMRLLSPPEVTLILLQP